MKNLLILFSICILLVNSACQFNPKEKKDGENKVDSEIKMNPDSELFYFDSLQIISFSRLHSLNLNYQKNLYAFYEKRNDAFVWINHSGINEYGRNLVNLLSHEDELYHQDHVLYDRKLDELYRTLSVEGYIFKKEDTAMAELELILTINFFEYAKRNWHGVNDEKLKQVGWFIERKPIKYNALLDTILKGDPDKISSYQPVYRQYGLLKKYLQKYRDLEVEGGWLEVPSSIKLRNGDTSFIIPEIKKSTMVDDCSFP